MGLGTQDSSATCPSGTSPYIAPPVLANTTRPTPLATQASNRLMDPMTLTSTSSLGSRILTETLA